MEKKTILLYGRTGSGKTALLGEFAEYLFATTGKRTRIYTADRGGVETIRPYVNLGIIQVVEIENSDPWIFLHNAASGKLRVDGKWIDSDLSGLAMVAFESMRSNADGLMESMKTKAANNVNIGGGSNVSFIVEGDGEKIKIGGANMAHYGVAQGYMTEKIFLSQRLPVPYVLWTSSVSKDEDINSGGKVLGPDVVGKALTPVVPQWFDYTFRTDVVAASASAKERHLLYLGNHQDINAGNAGALGNIRLPLDAKPLEKTIIEPASLVRAMQLLEGGVSSAEQAIKARLGNKLAALKQL